MSGLTIADYEEVLADKRRLTRELDIAMHGEDGAAVQASLCDLIEPAKKMRAEIERLRRLLMKCHQWINPNSDPMNITNKQMMAEIETAITARASDVG